jgi:hypothetical protein
MDQPLHDLKEFQRWLSMRKCLRLLLLLTIYAGVQLMDQSFMLFDEGDWPGGIVQRFRALRPLVEGVLEG